MIARRTLLATLALPAVARAQPAWAPTRPIRIVVPYTAGGASDISARLIADRLRGPLGQAGVVEGPVDRHDLAGQTGERRRRDGRTHARPKRGKVSSGS